MNIRKELVKIATFCHELEDDNEIIFISHHLHCSASDRNEYQESSWEVKGGQRVGLTTLPPSVSRLSRQNVGAYMSYNPMGLHRLLQG
jgi:hypothetical protein